MGNCERHGNRGHRRDNGTGSLKFKKSEGVYYAVFSVFDESLGRSRRTSKSTHTASYKEAKDFLDKYIAEFHMKGALVSKRRASQSKYARAERDAFLLRLEEKRDSLLMARLQEEKKRREEAAKNAALEKERNSISISAAFVYYSSSKRRPDSGERTLRGYESQFSYFAKYMADHHPEITKIHAVTPQIAEEFLTHLEGVVSRNTRNKYLIFLRRMWKTLKFEPDSLIDVDPWEGITTLKILPDTVHHKNFTVQQMQTLFSVVKREDMKQPLAFETRPKNDQEAPSHIVDLRDELFRMMNLQLYLGCRCGDACASVSWDGIDLDAETITYIPRKRDRTYDSPVIIPIHPVLKSVLVQIPDDERKGYVCPNLAIGYLRTSGAAISKRFNCILRAAGLNPSVEAPSISGGKNKRPLYGTHSFRHFTLSHLSNSNINQKIVDYIGVHGLSEISTVYYHQNEEAIRKAILTLPDVMAV